MFGNPFARKLDAALNMVGKDYVDPDSFLYNSKKTVSFIYGPDGRLFTGDTIHAEIIKVNLPYFQQLFRGLYEYGLDGQETDFEVATMIREITNDKCVIGRVGSQKQSTFGKYVRIASFWPGGALNELLAGCIQKLLADKYINQESILAIPGQQLIQVKNAIGIQSEPDELAELAQKLHLLTGKAKHDAMKKLGVGGTKGRSKWQTELEKHGLSHPGKRIWAMQSEAHLRNRNRDGNQ